MANLELYLIFPLANEQGTITLVRGTMATGGVVLLVLLAGIALLVSRQVVVPVRSASRIAERFAEGHLSERMPVRGEDDMARLAVSFNDMAESLPGRSPSSRSSATCSAASPPTSATNFARR